MNAQHIDSLRKDRLCPGHSGVSSSLRRRYRHVILQVTRRHWRKNKQYSNKFLFHTCSEGIAAVTTRIWRTDFILIYFLLSNFTNIDYVNRCGGNALEFLQILIEMSEWAMNQNEILQVYNALYWNAIIAIYVTRT